MVSEQFDSGRRITQFDDLEECEDLEYVEEKLVKTQEHCDSINKTMQKIMKMLDKMSESIEELGKRTLKRTVRSDSVEKGNPDRRTNTISNTNPDLYLNPNPKSDPNSSLDPYPKWNPKSVPNLNLKLDSSSESEIAMDVETIEEAYSDNEGDEESKIKIDRDFEEEIEVVGIHLEPLLPPSPPPLPLPPPYLHLTPPSQRDLPLNRTKARNKNSCKSLNPNPVILFWPKPIQVSTSWPKSKLDFNGSDKYTPNFTNGATSQSVQLIDGRGKLQLPLPPPPLPIPTRPPPSAIELFMELFYILFYNGTCAILCEASAYVYCAIHPFNEKDDLQIKRDGIMRYGEQLSPQKFDHRVTSSPLGRFFGYLTFAPTMKFFWTEIPDTSHVEMVASDGVVNRITVSKCVEEAQQKLKVKLVLKGNGSFMAEQFEVRKSRWWREKNGYRLLGSKNTSFLQLGLKIVWKNLFFLEPNWGDYFVGPKQFILFFLRVLVLEEKDCWLAKRQDEVDRFSGTKVTSHRFSSPRVWLGNVLQNPRPPPLPPPPISIVDRMLLNRYFYFFPP